MRNVHETISVTQKNVKGNYQLFWEMHTYKSPLTYAEATSNNAKL